MTELEKAARKCVFDELCVWCCKRVYTHCEYMAKTKDEPICKEGKVVHDKFIAGAQWQAKQSPWISVEERRPKEGERVWVKCSRFNNLPLFYSACRFRTSLNGGSCDDSVTHWMSIPE